MHVQFQETVFKDGDKQRKRVYLHLGLERSKAQNLRKYQKNAAKAQRTQQKASGEATM